MRSTMVKEKPTKAIFIPREPLKGCSRGVSLQKKNNINPRDINKPSRFCLNKAAPGK